MVCWAHCPGRYTHSTQLSRVAKTQSQTTNKFRDPAFLLDGRPLSRARPPSKLTASGNPELAKWVPSHGRALLNTLVQLEKRDARKLRCSTPSVFKGVQLHWTRRACGVKPTALRYKLALLKIQPVYLHETIRVRVQTYLWSTSMCTA